MLSKIEKREMLDDAKSARRRRDFAMARSMVKDTVSFDEYVSFLDDMQKIFAPFKMSSHRTITKSNKL